MIAFVFNLIQLVIYSMRAFLYALASGHGGQRLQGAGGRLCDSYKRQKRRNGECSLDTDPGFEANVLRQSMTPDEYIEARETTFALYDALTQLPPTQARRVYQHYLLGMSKAEIAAAEGVGRSRICCSVERGLAAMKNILKKSL